MRRGMKVGAQLRRPSSDQPAACGPGTVMEPLQMLHQPEKNACSENVFRTRLPRPVRRRASFVRKTSATTSEEHTATGAFHSDTQRQQGSSGEDPSSLEKAREAQLPRAPVACRAHGCCSRGLGAEAHLWVRA